MSESLMITLLHSRRERMDLTNMDKSDYAKQQYFIKDLGEMLFLHAEANSSNDKEDHDKFLKSHQRFINSWCPKFNHSEEINKFQNFLKQTSNLKNFIDEPKPKELNKRYSELTHGMKPEDILMNRIVFAMDQYKKSTE